MLKQKLQSPCFWTAIVGALLMLLQAFHIEFNIPIFNQLISILGAMLVCCGCLLDRNDSDKNKPAV